ncbi:MAG: EAL domain-containing protein [Proteobacteria bacterium]|nr:EAL domain-containing protein [Pseudomonadota bacterium]
MFAGVRLGFIAGDACASGFPVRRQPQMVTLMQTDERTVLIVASSREDRRMLFDALDGMGFSEILSAPNAGRARSLLQRSARPALAILDFEHGSNSSQVLCAELADVPVLGLFGARFLARRGHGRPDGCVNIKAWLGVPVATAEVGARIRAALNGTAAAAMPAQCGAAPRGAAIGPPPADGVAILRAVADLLQPIRDAEGWPGLAQRAMRVLGMDVMAIASREVSGGPLKPLVQVGGLPLSNPRDLLAEAFVQQSLQGTMTLGLGKRMPPEMAAYARATGCACCAAAPLLDARGDVLGVLACAARHAAPDRAQLSALLEIVAARCAALLAVRREDRSDRDRTLRDGLTGLPNRMLFHDRLESALHDARRTGEVLAVLFVDLDRFKGVNDSLGHDIGDQVLVAVAERLRGLLRASDTVARYAGDEFTLILRHVNGRADVARVAAKLLSGMQVPLTLGNGSELHVTASIGVSIYPDDATDPEGLLKHADVAMYSAKGEGRNQVKAFGNGSGETHRQRLEMESRLRDAEAKGELLIHYQPQVDLASGATVAVEALVRWQHPVLGMLSPGFFVPLAEETGLIISIGEWVLRRACADVAEWRRATGSPLRLAVNLSALQWQQPNLVAMIQAACGEAGLELQALDLETPEGMLADPQPELVAGVGELRALGCRVVIDDAGVAPVTTERAPRLSVDAIKIDRSFVHNIGSDRDDESVVLAVLASARRRRLRTIAEGVETAFQLAFLRKHGCGVAQGYLFCRPLPAAVLGQRLAKPGGATFMPAPGDVRQSDR